MPALDDIASLYYEGGGWQVHYTFSEETSVGDLREARPRSLSEEVLRDVLEEMTANAA